jgi:hypothetical protein
LILLHISQKTWIPLRYMFLSVQKIFENESKGSLYQFNGFS